MRFPDSNFLNIVIRCTRVGVVDLSGSNSWQNLHIYATCNKDPSGANVAVGFYAGGSQTRIGATYFDDSPVRRAARGRARRRGCASGQAPRPSPTRSSLSPRTCGC